MRSFCKRGSAALHAGKPGADPGAPRKPCARRSFQPAFDTLAPQEPVGTGTKQGDPHTADWRPTTTEFNKMERSVAL